MLMKKMLVAGGAALMACMLVAGCGETKTADGREIKVRPKTGETIDPPEKAFDLKGNAGEKKN